PADNDRGRRFLGSIVGPSQRTGVGSPQTSFLGAGSLPDWIWGLSRSKTGKDPSRCTFTPYGHSTSQRPHRIALDFGSRGLKQFGVAIHAARPRVDRFGTPALREYSRPTLTRQLRFQSAIASRAGPWHSTRTGRTRDTELFPKLLLILRRAP